MIRFRNTKLVQKEHLELAKDLGDYIEDYFFTPKLKKKLETTVYFRENYFKETGNYADCVWEDTHVRPLEFTINFEPKQKLAVFLNTFAHEMVHVKQWAKGEMYVHQRDLSITSFRKQLIDTNKVNYWDQPWEIEAYGRSVGLVVQWAQDRKLTNWKKLLPDS